MEFGHEIDRAAFDVLLVEHIPNALRFAIRLTGDVHRGEDLAHDAVLRALKHWRSYRGQSKFTSWFFQIIVNVFRDRVPAMRMVEETEVESDSPEVSREVEATELREIIARHVSSLPPRQREVLVLVVYENLSQSEAASVLRISEQNLRTTLHLARERMRTKLSSHLKEEIRD